LEELVPENGANDAAVIYTALRRLGKQLGMDFPASLQERLCQQGIRAVWLRRAI
jgi:hypothetical protein